MDNRTQINPNVGGMATEINSSLGGNATAINQAVYSTNKLTEGTVIAEKYVVKSKMEAVTGEADLYICEYNGEEYVTKVYRREVAIKPEVVDILKSIDSPFIAKIYDTGVIDGYPFEILPYYKNGSLQGKKYSYAELKEHIIPSINEGLKVLHQHKIIHKDLKPSNIMIQNNGHDIAIIDFGVSSVREEGKTFLVTKTGMTPEYSAPETFKNLFFEISDYYSFGITLFELFCGYSPYSHMNREQIDQSTSIEKIPMPQDVPTELADLINALTYYDITNRNNKDNPNKRWSYDEVKNWCDGKEQIIPGEGVGNSKADMPPYAFNGKDYTEILQLIKAFAQNWSDGKKQLFRGLMSGFFKSFNPEIAGFCMDAEEQARLTNGRDDYIFWKLLYKLAPELKGFYWQGMCYESLPALGRDILEKLWSGKESECKQFDSIITEGILSEYITMVAPDNDDLKTAVKGFETSFKVAGTKSRDKMMNYYLLGYMFSNQKIFCIDNIQFRTVGELAEHMKSLLDKSFEEFQAFCHKLIDFNDQLHVGFESWLMAMGKTNELAQWRESLR